MGRLSCDLSLYFLSLSLSLDLSLIQVVYPERKFKRSLFLPDDLFFIRWEVLGNNKIVVKEARKEDNGMTRSENSNHLP